MFSDVTLGSGVGRNRFCSLLSLCKRAGQLVSGETACEAAIKTNRARIVLIALDASGNTAKKFINKSGYYNVPAFRLDITKELMGKTIGEEQRSVITVIGGDFTEQFRIILESRKADA